MKKENTICPMLIATGNPAINTTCGKELCAWWMPNDKCCAVVVLAASAAVTSEALNTEIQVVNYEGS